VLYGLSFDLLNSYDAALGFQRLVVLAAASGLQTLARTVSQRGPTARGQQPNQRDAADRPPAQS